MNPEPTSEPRREPDGVVGEELLAVQGLVQHYHRRGGGWKRLGGHGSGVVKAVDLAAELTNLPSIATPVPMGLPCHVTPRAGVGFARSRWRPRRR